MSETKHLRIEGGAWHIDVNVQPGDFADLTSYGLKDKDRCHSEHDQDLQLQYNAAIDGIEALILAHAGNGINVESPAYAEAVRTAVEQIGNEFA